MSLIPPPYVLTVFLLLEPSSHDTKLGYKTLFCRHIGATSVVLLHLSEEMKSLDEVASFIRWLQPRFRPFGH